MKTKQLQNSPVCVTIRAKDGWLICPTCRARLLHTRPETVCRNLPVYCRKCSAELIVNISPQLPEP